MKRYLKVWFLYAINSVSVQLMVRWAVTIFLFGKIFRFGVFLLFIIFLVSKTSALAGYNLHQTVLFYLTFNLIDISSQLLFREVYRFRPTIVNGTFDFTLIKPLSPLFRSLVTGPDVLDLITLIPLVVAIGYFISLLSFNFIGLLTYIFLLVLGFVIALSFHILVLSLAVLTTEIDHAILVYRDITSMGRMPIDIYKEPIRGFLTFVIPVGIMMSFPVKSLLGLLSPVFILYAFVFTAIFFYLSLQAWWYSLKQYSSASS